jgi:hypothetical protein
VSTITGPEKTSRDGRLAHWALFLGALSVILVVLGFGWLPFGFDLGILLAIVALALGIRALRRGGMRPAALAGVALGLLTVLAALFVILAFAFAPGD